MSHSLILGALVGLKRTGIARGRIGGETKSQPISSTRFANRENSVRVTLHVHCASKTQTSKNHRNHYSTIAEAIVHTSTISRQITALMFAMPRPKQACSCLLCSCIA